MINRLSVAALLLTAVLATMHAHGTALLEPGDTFPREEGRVTVIRLDDNPLVESIRFWNPEDDSIRDVLP